MSQKVGVSNFIHNLDDSIFVKSKPLNKFSKGVKRKCGLTRTDCIFKVNYCKVKITENSGKEWDEIARETVGKVNKKALKKSNF